MHPSDPFISERGTFANLARARSNVVILSAAKNPRIGLCLASVSLVPEVLP